MYTSTPLYLLSKKDSLDGDAYVSFSVSVFVYEIDGALISNDVRYFNKLFKKGRERDVLNTEQEFNFKFNVPENKYLVWVEVVDNHTKIGYRNKAEIKIKNSEQEILISDPVYYDSTSKKRIISDINNFPTRDGEITVHFVTYQKNKLVEYFHHIKCDEKVTTVENFIYGTVNIFADIYKIIKKIASSTVEPDTSSSYLTLYRTTLENPSKNNYKEWGFTVPKSTFDNVNFSYRTNYKKAIELSIQTYKHLNINKKGLEEVEGVTHIDSINANELSENETYGDSWVIASVEEVGNTESEFSFYWHFIPQTEADMTYFVTQIAFFFGSEIKDDILNGTLEEQKQKMKSFWYDFSLKYGEINEVLAMKRFFAKLKFIEKNFIEYKLEPRDFTDLVVYRPVKKFFKNTWKSDKAIIYIKYGLPDEIEGVSVIGADRKPIARLLELPWQKWTYHRLDRPYTFVQNTLQHNSKFGYKKSFRVIDF